MSAEDETTFLALKRYFIEGIPRRSIPDERADAERLFSVLARIGGEKLVGPGESLPAGLYWNDVLTTLTLGDLASGVGKSFFFGYFITIVGCYNGLTTEGGADGVGRATTNTVVLSAILVLVSDFFLTKLLF